MSQLPAPIRYDLELEAATLAQESARVESSWVSKSRSLGAGLEAQWAKMPQALRVQVELQVAQALRIGLGVAKAGPQTSPRQQRWLIIAAGAAGGSVGLAGALAELPFALVVFLQAIRDEARAAGLDPDRDGVALASLDILSSGKVLGAAEVLDPAYLSGRLALAGPSLSGWIARTVPRLVPLIGPRLAASAVPLVGALGGAVLNAAWLEHYRRLARIRFRLMALAEHHGAEAVVRAFARAQAVPAVD
ncbi:MAG: EcsC family protein [Pseudomonadota bacterium]